MLPAPPSGVPRSPVWWMASPLKPKTVTVTAATLVSLLVTPSSPSFADGTTEQFTVTGTFSDGTTEDLTGQAVWTSSNPQVLTINAAGLASGGAPGSVQVTRVLRRHKRELGNSPGKRSDTEWLDLDANHGHRSQRYDPAVHGDGRLHRRHHGEPVIYRYLDQFQSCRRLDQCQWPGNRNRSRPGGDYGADYCAVAKVDR